MANAWSAFYWGDYVADTGHLSLPEHGAYLLLMAHYYRTRRPLPANASVLHRVCRCTTDADRAATDRIVQEFFIRDGDMYRHHRIDRELTKAFSLSEVRRAAANARYEKQRAANADAHAMQMPIQSQPQPQSEPNKDKARKRAKSLIPLPENFSISERVRHWAAAKGHARLEEHLEHFIGYARANGKRYEDWDQAFMNAVRGDWAHLKGSRNGSGNQNRAEERQASNLAACAETKRFFGLAD